MPVDYSQAKIYKNVARNLVQSVCYHIFDGKLCPSVVRKRYGPIDFESDYMKRIFFTCDGKEYYIRLWDIKQSPSRTGRTKIEYSAYEEYRCNDCDEEFSRELPNGWTRCRNCAKHYTHDEDLPGNKIEVKNEEQIGQQTTTTTNQE
jgi:ribosomal protein L37AE/L43A